MRTLVSVQKILDIQAIPGADAIEVAQVLGWHVVVKKGEFQTGDLAVYYEVDSLLPPIPEYDFLAKNGLKKTEVDGKIIEGYRLRTIKLRGQISQGLCLPTSILPDGAPEPVEGLDVTDLLGVVKFEQIMAATAGSPKGAFPSFIPKTDETRIQSAPEILQKYVGTEVYITEKLDGSSCTVFAQDSELNVCSRNTNWLPESDNEFWQAVRRAGLEDKADQLGTIAIQGEVVGGKVQGNKLGVGVGLYVFSAYDYKAARHLDYKELYNLCEDLDLSMVPVLDVLLMEQWDVDEWVAYATRKSVLNPNIWAEGIVVRSINETYEPLLGGRLSFKVINPEFLLKED